MPFTRLYCRHSGACSYNRQSCLCLAESEQSEPRFWEADFRFWCGRCSKARRGAKMTSQKMPKFHLFRRVRITLFRLPIQEQYEDHLVLTRCRRYRHSIFGYWRSDYCNLFIFTLYYDYKSLKK